MSWLSEDPSPLAGTLVVVAVGFLIAMGMTQQGKHLIRALIALGLAAGIVAVEYFWVTERERVEAVVYDLGAAVRRSDADAVLGYMTPDVTISQMGRTIGGRPGLAPERFVPGLPEGVLNPARAVIRGTVQSARFDILSISRVNAHAGQQTGRGRADFRVFAAGSFGSFNFGTPTSGTDWSLGFRKVDDRWMVESITATRLPGNYEIPLTAAPEP